MQAGEKKEGEEEAKPRIAEKAKGKNDGKVLDEEEIGPPVVAIAGDRPLPAAAKSTSHLISPIGSNALHAALGKLAPPPTEGIGAARLGKDIVRCDECEAYVHIHVFLLFLFGYI